jgi:hypothetical protein
MALLGIAVALSIAALTAGAIGFCGPDARAAAAARAMFAILLLAALVLFAFVALDQNPLAATDGAIEARIPRAAASNEGSRSDEAT